MDSTHILHGFHVFYKDLDFCVLFHIFYFQLLCIGLIYFCVFFLEFGILYVHCMCVNVVATMNRFL